MRMRRASADDVALLRRWDSEPHVAASDPNDDWQWETELGRDLAWREEFIAEVDGRPIGFLQIMDPAGDEERYWGDVGTGVRALDIWIGEPDLLGRGHGTRMMRWAIERCFADPVVTVILIDPLVSNTRAIRFYRRLGFEFVHERRFGADLCAVHQLTRSAWERGVAGPG